IGASIGSLQLNHWMVGKAWLRSGIDRNGIGYFGEWGRWPDEERRGAGNVESDVVLSRIVIGIKDCLPQATRASVVSVGDDERIRWTSLVRCKKPGGSHPSAIGLISNGRSVDVGGHTGGATESKGKGMRLVRDPIATGNAVAHLNVNSVATRCEVDGI